MKRTPFTRTPFVAIRKPLAAMSARRRRDNRERTKNVNAMRAVDQSCARCGASDIATFGHEFLGRAQGGDFVNPDVLLCNICNGWCEDNPIPAAEQGWKISRKYDRIPAPSTRREVHGNARR